MWGSTRIAAIGGSDWAQGSLTVNSQAFSQGSTVGKACYPTRMHFNLDPDGHCKVRWN